MGASNVWVHRAGRVWTHVDLLGAAVAWAVGTAVAGAVARAAHAVGVVAGGVEWTVQATSHYYFENIWGIILLGCLGGRIGFLGRIKVL